MTVVQFSAETHYEEISHWWQAHKWPVIPLDHLSEFGSVVMDGEVPVCAGWLYRTGSAFAWFEWTVVNPNCAREVRKEGVTTLLDFVKHLATNIGAKTIFTSAHTRNAPWLTRLEKNGFTVTDTKMTNLICRVGG